MIARIRGFPPLLAAMAAIWPGWETGRPTELTRYRRFFVWFLLSCRHAKVAALILRPGHDCGRERIAGQISGPRRARRPDCGGGGVSRPARSRGAFGPGADGADEGDVRPTWPRLRLFHLRDASLHERGDGARRSCVGRVVARHRTRAQRGGPDLRSRPALPRAAH